MRGGRWLVGLGALLIAALAIYVLTRGGPEIAPGANSTPAMDEIDAESRAAMRELLRRAEED